MRYFFFIFIVLFFSCERDKRNKTINENLDKEITNRLSILRGLSKYDDSLALQSVVIHDETRRLILLSKDVENFRACVVMSNKYFSALSSKLRIDLPENLALNMQMDPGDAELRLKENELWSLNKIIFNNSGAEIQLFSAQEELLE
jgi:hypothetical protein